jgi:hypothetical protein
MVHAANALTGFFAEKLEAAFSKEGVAAATQSKAACGENFVRQVDHYWYVLNYSLAYLALLETSLQKVAPALAPEFEGIRNARFQAYGHPRDRLLEGLAGEYRDALETEDAEGLAAVTALLTWKCRNAGPDIDWVQVARVHREELNCALRRTSDEVILALTARSRDSHADLEHTDDTASGVDADSEHAKRKRRHPRAETPVPARPDDPLPSDTVSEERVVATLKISETSELVFYLDCWRERTWANVRKFLHGERYVGATKAGVKLELDAVPQIVGVLSSMCSCAADIEQREYLRLPAAGNQFVALRGSLYKGMLGADLRVWFSRADDALPTKKGVRIPIELLPEAVECFRQLAAAGAPGGAAPFPNTPHEEHRPRVNCTPTEGIPPELADLFNEE